MFRSRKKRKVADDNERGRGEWLWREERKGKMKRNRLWVLISDKITEVIYNLCVVYSSKKIKIIVGICYSRVANRNYYSLNRVIS